MNWQVLRSLDSNAHLVALDGQHRDRNIIANLQRFANSASQNKHGQSLVQYVEAVAYRFGEGGSSNPAPGRQAGALAGDNDDVIQNANVQQCKRLLKPGRAAAVRRRRLR